MLATMLRISSTFLWRPKLYMHSKFIPNVGFHGILWLLKIILLFLHLSKETSQTLLKIKAVLIFCELKLDKGIYYPSFMLLLALVINNVTQENLTLFHLSHQWVHYQKGLFEPLLFPCHSHSIIHGGYSKWACKIEFNLTRFILVKRN